MPRIGLLVTQAGSSRPVDALGGTTLGSAPTCGIQISEAGVDPRHAIIDHHEGRWVIGDLGSTSGIWLNEAPVFERTVLRVGDRLQLGAAEVRVVRRDG
ncbi:FHA domain-containing protein [Aquihabitans daechungensis]|uniref:FHA domain-containing protein n=1 Tax=Aquihabitans daechungensis TaxID=1052257 RepID=UPI003B9F455D